ncbi:MAG: 3,4-dihydroxy-2-butanone 4-phosphate synthase / GTP cyclohydrolase II, partial [uncultured Solirubrobacteraceae bacterium]
ERQVASVRINRGGDRGDPRRPDGRRLRRRGSRERGRPHHGGAVRDAGGDQLHGPRGPRAHLPGPDLRALRGARPRPDGGQERVAVRDGVHRLGRGPRGGHHRHLGRRPGPDHPGGDRSALLAARPGPARARLPAQGEGGRRPRTHGSDRGGGRPGAARRPQPLRRDLRDHERRRDDGAGLGPRALLRAARAQDGHRRRPDRLPPAPRSARRAGGLDHAADRVRDFHGGRLPVAGRRQAPRRDGQGRRPGQGGRARPRALRVPDRRCLPLAALRLRRAARIGAGDDRGRGGGSPPLPRAGGPGDRPAEQAQGLQPPGRRPRHRRREHRARPAGGPPRLRHRGPDPRRPRPLAHPHPHQQPEEDPRAGGLRAVGVRAGADRPRAQPAQRGLPARQARPARSLAAPPGTPARRGARARGAPTRRDGRM